MGQCNERTGTETYGGVEGRQDAGGAGREVRRARQPDPAIEDVVAGWCDWVFMSPAEKRGTERAPTAKEMQAKIGQLVLEVDFLEVALDRVGDASAKR